GRWSRRQWLDYLRGNGRQPPGTAASDPVVLAAVAAAPAREPALSGAGFRVRALIVRPGGRGYFIWRRDAEAARATGAMP
ncbi:MAG: hypothetical protein KGL25_03085, partial [Gammaproteobacteria bacterium]|nr:hypothetical protein [Gammaproteobacteria bacterium]